MTTGEADDHTYNGLVNRLSRVNIHYRNLLIFKLENGYQKLMNLVTSKTNLNVSDMRNFVENGTTSRNGTLKNAAHHPSIPDHLVAPSPLQPHVNYIEKNKKFVSEMSHFNIIR
jgi:hypothetical protein